MKSKEYDNSDEILIVEDSPTQAQMLKFLLEKHNYRISVACNGREALDMLNKHKPMLVISDIVMPEMDGYQLCRSIKDNKNLKDIPVILLTSLSDPVDVLKGLECGADNFIIKPYDEKYLLSRIQYVLANRVLHEREKMQMGIEIFFGDQKYYITSERQQILNLLISTYETAVHKNLELQRAQDELKNLNDGLENKVNERTASYLAELEERKRAEDSLLKFKLGIERADEAIFMTDIDGTIQYVNPAFEKIYGYSSEEASGKTPRILKSGLLPAEAYKQFWETLLEKKVVRGELVNKTKDGRILNIEGSTNPILNEDGNIIGFLAIQRDISERKKREEKLQLFRTLINKSNDAIFVNDPENGRILDANDKACKTLGYEREELLNMRVFDFEAVLPDDFSWKEHIKDIQKKGYLIMEGQHRRKDGTTFPVEVNVNIIVIGHNSHMVDVVRDITERKQAKDALEASLKNWQNTFNSISDSVFILDMEGRIIQSNGVFEHMIGINTEDVLGQYCYKAIHCRSDFIEDCPFKRMKQTRMRESFEFEDKERGVWFQVTMDPVYSESGEIINAVHIIRDVTELKKAEETRFENIQLVLANKAKSDFLSHMSHELRTPLNSIIGFSELLVIKTEGELNKKQEHYINNVIASSKHLLTLINDILDLSKVEAGKIELVIEKISLSETINDAVSLMKERAMKHNVTIKKDIDPQLEIEADKQRIKQILFNLLSNAVKFSKPEGGDVTITATKEEDMAKISVSDTGIGIREENMKKLFMEFEQLDKGISQKYGGTGLGLSITKRLVEMHGGKIWAESKYGEGTTFIFMLPMTANKRGEIVSDER